MKLAALAGGIGCGKTTVATMLAERGAVVVDVDQLSRGLQRPGAPVFEAMVQRWGAQIVAADGTLDRTSVAEVVFANGEEMAALMAMTNPAMEQALYEAIRVHQASDVVVVLESALLSSPGAYGTTGLIVVDATEEVALSRLMRSRSMAEADARARMANQPSRGSRLARADVIIDNSGTPDALVPQVAAAWRWLRGLDDSEARPTVQ